MVRDVDDPIDNLYGLRGDEINLTADDEDADLPNMATKYELIHDVNKERVRQILRRANDRGATPQEIAKVINLGTQTVKKYLEELCATREAYKLKRNKTTTMYYNNGRPRHDFGVERIEEGNSLFELSLAEGPQDTLLLHIIEKRFTLLEGETIEGGVIVPVSRAPSLIEKINRLYELSGGGNGIRT